MAEHELGIWMFDTRRGGGSEDAMRIWGAMMGMKFSRR